MLERIHFSIIRETERLGTLTAAAQSLCLTQSALSHTMRKLEQKLGTAIWLREGRTLQLTQSGHYLLNVANRILPQLEHAEAQLKQFAQGHRGELRIGMECHPCYQWLLKVVSPFLEQWPNVDIDVKQKFQFGGMGALYGHEIDLLVTPDPIIKPGSSFEPVFEYEQVLVVNNAHKLAKQASAEPRDLMEEVLITYPVAQNRLDIFTHFLSPAGITPKQHKTIETTDIMLQMVASKRGVAALPKWLAQEYQSKLPIKTVRLGKKGVPKKIYLGVRDVDKDTDYLKALIQIARNTQHP
ncbi:LysR family transcriptional regulator [Reinekea forsetii]|nr:LysR family transcriptional regulator [Reinekea forsetii]